MLQQNAHEGQQDRLLTAEQVKTQCSVWLSGRNYRECQNPGAVEFNGRWYCRKHWREKGDELTAAKERLEARLLDAEADDAYVEGLENRVGQLTRLLAQAMAALAQLERPVPCADPDALSETDGGPCKGHCRFCDVANDPYHPHVHDLDCTWLLTHNALHAAGITPSPEPEPDTEEASDAAAHS